jgi:hypothetical protein
MKKADPGEESPAEQTPDGSSSEPPAPGPADDAPANDADPAQDASPSEAPAEETPGEDPAADAQPMSVDELTQEYLKLPPDQLKTHMEACKAALMAMAGGAPAPQAPPPAPMPESAGPEAAMKSNKVVSDLQKKVEELSAKLLEQNKSFETSIEKLALVLEKPLQKSVTRISQIPQKSGKTTTMSQDQIKARLNEVSRTPDLKKSDRQAINQFVTGRAPIETIAHLLK